MGQTKVARGIFLDAFFSIFETVLYKIMAPTARNYIHNILIKTFILSKKLVLVALLSETWGSAPPLGD